jgi:hypothetical protein
MEISEFEKSKVFTIVDILEYAVHSVVSKAIIKKITGNISIAAFNAGEAQTAKVSPFDTFILIIDGIAEIVINNSSNTLKTGQSIIIPAHAHNTIKANEQFKMLSGFIKSGYE